MPVVGLGIPTPAPDARPDTPLHFARRAEAVGAHSVWAIDRLVLDNQEALVALAAAAGATERVRLGTSILLGTLRPPLLLAKMVATLDQVSNGRVILGLGVGSRADDFAAVQVPFERRGPRLGEQIRLLKAAWSGEPIDHQGGAYSVGVGPVGPPPRQRPHPPLWLGGSSDAALRRAARLADGYVGGASRGAEGFRANWQKVRRFAEEAGRDPDALTPAVLVYAVVDDDRDRALGVAARYMDHYYGSRRPGVSPAELVGSAHLVGPADEAARKAQAYFEAGAEVLILGSMTADPAYLDRLCDELLPRLR